MAYFKGQFQELKQELGTHSALLSTMNDSVRRLADVVQSFRCTSLQHSQEKFQDSTGANPKKTVFGCSGNEGLLKIEEENDCALEGEAKSYKRETPSFGRAVGYLSGSRNEHNTPQFRFGKDAVQNNTEEVCVESLECSSDESRINSVFSPSQPNNSSKMLIIEPIDIEFHNLSRKAKFEKNLTPSNDTRKMPDSLSTQSKTSRNLTPYSAISFNIKNGSARITGNKDLKVAKKVFFRPKVSNSTARSRLFESFSQPDREDKSPKGKKKVGFQKTVALAIGKRKAKKRVSPSGLEKIPVRCLYLISRYMGQELPAFVFSSKLIMLKYLPFRTQQIEKICKKLQRQYLKLVTRAITSRSTT